MSNLKISALADGSPAQGADEVPVKRGAGNVRLSVSDIATAAAMQDASAVAITGGTIDNVRQSNAPIFSHLANWSKSAPSGKTIAWVGDSTTMHLASEGVGGVPAVQSYYLARHVTPPGGSLYNTTNLYYGSNGDTLENFVNNPDGALHINAVIADAPDLVVLCYGVNDVRQGATSEAQLLVLLKQTVNALRVALPSCDIVLRMPGPFLTTDVGSLGYVVPNGSAQAYSTILKNAYRALRNYWPNVVLYDSQAALFPETSPASYGYMVDQAHPSVGGYWKIYDQLAALIAESSYPARPISEWEKAQSELAALLAITSYNPGRAASAVYSSYADAHTYYPNVVFNGDYELITSGGYVTQGSGFIRFSGDLRAIGRITYDDILWMNGEFAFTMLVVSTSVSGANIQLSSLGAGIPTYTQTGGMVAVFRHKYGRMLTARSYVNSPTYPVWQFFDAGGAGSNYIRLAARKGEPDAAAFNITTADTLVHPTLGAVSLSGATFAYINPTQVQISKSGTDFTMPVTAGTLLLAGPGVNRPSAQTPQLITFEQYGALVDGTFNKSVLRGGVYSTVRATLGTAGTSTSTVVIARGGSTVLTITFGNGVTDGSLAWASGSSFQVIAPATISMAMTKGTGAPADLAIAIDV